MIPRHQVRSPTPTTGGSVADRTPCMTYPAVYDALLSVVGTSRKADPEAVQAARNLCATCVLNQPAVADKCIRRAIDAGETWVAVMLGRDLRKPPTIRGACGKSHGSREHSRHGERSCDACRKASSKLTLARRRRKREAAA